MNEILERFHNGKFTDCTKEIEYLSRIKNKAKRHYASLYFDYLHCGGTEPNRGELSYMAAQSVRINLNELFKAASNDKRD